MASGSGTLFPVKIYWIIKCTSTGYALPFLSSRQKKGRRKEELRSKISFKPFF
jgi:hypothetical protein